MIRRIAGTFFALLTALLVLAVVPLGITKAESQHDSFRFDTDSAARVVASDAEEVLSDHEPTTELHQGLTAAASTGDCAAVYNADAGLIAKTACTRASGTIARTLVARVQAGEHAADPDADLTAQDGQWLLVAVPVGGDESDGNAEVTGFVVYARNGDPMDDRIDAMWGWLLLTSGGSLALAGFLSVRLARWVTRPLGSLSDAAARLGGGDLGVRAAAEGGPEQVRQLAETFNWMAERIETLVHGHRSWIADVSHQLRTPLTALRLRLDLLGADADDEHTAAELAGAQEEIARLSRLVDGLLAIARAESAVPRRIPVRADLVAHERVAAWAPVAAEKGVELEVRAPAGPVTIALGDGDLEQILDNLLANAIEAAIEAVGESSPGRVHIEVTPQGRTGNATGSGSGSRSEGTSTNTSSSASGSGSDDRAGAAVRVVDDGPGMSDERKAAAFHRFGHPESRGNGLGLAIVDRLTTANGGRASLRDTPGGGLTIELDWSHASPPPPPPPTSSATAATAATAAAITAAGMAHRTAPLRSQQPAPPTEALPPPASATSPATPPRP